MERDVVCFDSLQTCIGDCWKDRMVSGINHEVILFVLFNCCHFTLVSFNNYYVRIIYIII